MKTAAEQQIARQKAGADRVRARRKREVLVVKDWRKGIGKLKDTPMAREADALGERWRRAQKDRSAFMLSDPSYSLYSLAE